MSTLLERKIKERLLKQDILLMSHVVMGYPSFEQNIETVREYSHVGVDLIELQFPFSEPIADGPTLMIANQSALERGTSVAKCFETAKAISDAAPEVGFVIMTYYNIIYQVGEMEFARRASEAGIIGVIVHDLPPEQSGPFADACDTFGVSPIFLVTPQTPPERVAYICSLARGMVYCVARVGVSGYNTLFSSQFDSYLDQCRSVTNLPIGVGFGVKSRADVQHLTGRAQIAIVCSEAVKIAVEQGAVASALYLQSLRENV